MLSLPSVFDILSKVDTYPAEDLVDRLNFGASVYLLAFFVLITGSKQHFGTPIQCMAPPESADSWVNYYHDYCYIQDKLMIRDMNVRKSIDFETYFRTAGDATPIGQFYPADTRSRSHQGQEDEWTPRVMYYQWVPYVLFLQAIFFLLPKLFWKVIGAHWCNGVDMETAITEASKIRSLIGNDREVALVSVSKFIKDVLETKRKRPYFGSSIASVCYVVTKWLIVTNAVGQLYMLSYFVGRGDYFWGYTLLSTVLHGTDDPSIGAFPRIVLCHVTRFEMANRHEVHMQCVLMLNFINEKIYTFLWFWLVFVALASTISAIKQTAALLMSSYRTLVADSLLPTQEVLFSTAAADLGVRPTPITSRGLIDYFVNNILRCDGVLLLSFINGNAGGLVTHDIAHQLWKITVQPSFSLSSDFTDIEYGENKRDNLQWPYRNSKNRPFLELPHHRMSLKPRNTPRDSWNGDNKKPPIAKPLIRTRSLSAGNLVSYPPLPSAPFYNSPPTSEDDATLPIRNQSPHAPRCGPGVAVIKNGWDDKDI